LSRNCGDKRPIPTLVSRFQPCACKGYAGCQQAIEFESPFGTRYALAGNLKLRRSIQHGYLRSRPALAHRFFPNVNAGATLYFLCSVLDRCSRYVVQWNLREAIQEADAELSGEAMMNIAAEARAPRISGRSGVNGGGILT
jgi:hypothetical protein